MGGCFDWMLAEVDGTGDDSPICVEVYKSRYPMCGKAEIIDQLKKELLQMQGIKSCGEFSVVELPAAVNRAFPEKTFPTGVVHEFVSQTNEDLAATKGFVNTILQCLMAHGGPVIWISCGRKLFPPALKAYGIVPERVLFIDVQTQRDVLWATEETLKCDKLAAVVSELKDLNFIQSRKLQLAVESSRVTGFILRHQSRMQETTASVARWRISPLPALPEGTLPGLGYASWEVSLEKIRNGSLGNWQLVRMPDGLLQQSGTEKTATTITTGTKPQQVGLRKIV